jgi:DNA replication and repair protein RecF
MRLLHLSLTNFRNYARLELDVPAGIIVLQGDNAQGKTNLLEAIYYLSAMRSPRTKRDRELLNWLILDDELPFTRLVAQIQHAEESEQIELSLVQSIGKSMSSDALALRRHIRINGANKRMADAIGLLNAVLFLPQDIDLVSGAPKLRRRYLDDTISQIDAQYRRELQRYNRIVTRRNHLLKSFRGRSPDLSELVFWDRRLVQHGAYLIHCRQKTIQELNQAMQEIHPKLTNDQEWLQLQYSSSVRLEEQASIAYQMALPAEQSAALGAGNSPEQVAALFSQQLRRVQAKEMDRGVSMLGPHRDDFRFLVNGVDMNTYGSRGQQRTATLSLKLAEVEWIARAKNDQPVLLLDDVISELDAVHRSCLLEAVDAAQQVILTTTDLGHYGQGFLERASLWRVLAGRIETVTLG